ncbi:MAG: HAMP domain-containing histidine kinase [Acidobacteria bacterium]|nr:HAMP domain-containing histidine kinase [Acidobacteriota bacterium]
MAKAVFDPKRDLDPYVFFSSRICHDLNNMITGAQGAISLLEFKVDDLPEGAIDDDLRRLQRSVDQFNALSRRLEAIFLQADSQQKIPFDLNQLVAIRVKKTQSESHPISYLGEPFFSRFKVELLQDALEEAIKNAREAQPNGGKIDITLRVEARDSHSVAVLEIADQGVGVPAEYLTRIFEPFRSHVKRGNMVGLGLSMIGSAMAAHEGRLELESEPGKGSTLRMEFPD